MIAALMPGFAPQAAPGGGGGAAPGAARVFAPGTHYAFDPKINMYRIGRPKTSAGLGGIGVMTDGVFGDCLFGDCGLGAAATFTEEAPSPTTPPPDQATAVSLTQLQKEFGTLPIYKKPLFWIAIAGGVVVVGGGSFWLIRRRKKGAAAPAAAPAARSV